MVGVADAGWQGILRRPRTWGQAGQHSVWILGQSEKSNESVRSVHSPKVTGPQTLPSPVTSFLGARHVRTGCNFLGRG